MSRGIIDLIQENKRRFYAGEIRNRFYEESEKVLKTNQNTVYVNHSEQDDVLQTSFWKNLKVFSQKISEDLFYEPVK